ncbi:MAG: Hsp20/alpha crystallin family protein [Candidatus Latescibacterota bacterium]|nr:MAG: Hsp20/alpha crystallin family protein [Candidatus Latescibacterota bacterium]
MARKRNITSKEVPVMAIVRWNPVRDMFGLQEEMNMLFDDFFGLEKRGEDIGMVRWAPRVDIVEANGGYELHADLPGMKKEDIKIEIQDNMLTLRGERKLEDEKKNKNFRLTERFYGQFIRTFTLPENVNRDQIEAEFKDGVLKLAIPKVEKAKPKEIEVKVK